MPTKKTRCFMVYEDILINPKVDSLPGESYKTWIKLLAYASAHDGIIPKSLKAVAFALRTQVMQVESVITELLDTDLLDEYDNHYQPHDWEEWQGTKPSNGSTPVPSASPERVAERQRKFRAAHKQSAAKAITDSNAVTPVTRDDEDLSQYDEWGEKRPTSIKDRSLKPQTTPDDAENSNVTMRHDKRDVTSVTPFQPVTPPVSLACVRVRESKINTRPREEVQKNIQEGIRESERKGETENSFCSPASLANDTLFNLSAPEIPAKEEPEYTPEFEQFWLAYPRHEAKAKAMTIWKKKVATDTELAETIIAAVNKRKETKQWQNLEFVPIATTYLNQRRWEDELPAAAINGTLVTPDMRGWTAGQRQAYANRAGQKHMVY